MNINIHTSELSNFIIYHFEKSHEYTDFKGY